MTKQEFVFSALFWISIAFMAQWFNGIIHLFFDSMITVRLFSNSARPFIGGALAIGMWSLMPEKLTLKELNNFASSKLVIIPLFFMVAELLHFPAEYSAFTQFKFLFYSKLISTLWTCVVVAFIVELYIKNFGHYRFVRYLVYAISIRAVVYMVLAALLLFEIIPVFINNIIFNNSQAYESLVAIFIVLFIPYTVFKARPPIFLILINALPALFYESRGACFSLMIVLIFFLIQTFQKKILGTRKLLLLFLAVLFCLSAMTFKGMAPVGITTFNSIRKNVIKEFILWEQEKEEQEKEEQEKEEQEKGHFVSIFRIAARTIEEKWAEEEFEDIDSSDKARSSFSRKATIYLGLAKFIQNPIAGIGSYNACSLQVKGFGIHSLLPMILASYGILGFFPLLGLSLYFVSRYLADTGDFLGAGMVCTLVFLIMLFVNQFVYMYAFAVLFFWYGRTRPELKTAFA